MLGFLLFTLLLTMLFYSMGLNNQNKNFDIVSYNRIEHIKNNFHNLEERDTQILASALEVIVQDQGFKDVYLEKNREKLYNYGQPLFQNLKNKYGITHFYFILPDGHDFVRLHDKNIYEDLIERTTFQKARDTKEIASGIELGKTAFALRAVMPYYNNGELIGYVELGEDIDHLFKILKNQTSDEFAIIVDKEYLNREDWKSVRQTAGMRDNWDDLEKHLVISSTNNDETTAKCFVEDNLEKVEKGKLLLLQLQSKNQTFVCGGFTIIDAGGRHIGSILSLIDITDEVAVAQRAGFALFGVAIILFISTLTTGIIISRSISKPITKLRNAANSIGGGNFDTKIEIKSKDEIGELAASFKRMTGELQKTTVSKEYVDNIIRSIFCTLVVVEPDGKIKTVNKVTCDLLGYKAEELVGQPVDVLFDDSTQFKKSWLDELNEKASPTNIETTYLGKDGRKIPMLFSGSVMRHTNGRVDGMVCIALDITERKRAEEEIRKHDRYISVLYKIDHAASKSLDLQELLTDALDATLEAMGIETGSIFLLEQDGEKMRMHVHRGLSDEFIRNMQSIKLGEGVSGRAAAEKKPVVFNVSEYPTQRLAPYIVQEGLKTVASTPLISGGRLVGALNLGTRRTHTFSPDELELLTTIGIQIGGTVQNAQLYKQARQELIERKRAEEQIMHSLKEKEILLREIHHRVKNNMQIISSLLWLQSEYIKEKEYLEMFKDSQNRIISMSLIHEKLYRSKNLAKIDINEYITDLAKNLFEAYGVKAGTIMLKINVENVSFGIDSAIPCGLIINELISNSLKYAFSNGERGEIKVSCRNDGNMVELIVGDNGIGIPEDVDIRKTKSLGLRLITMLAEDQLHGEISLDRSRGTEFKIKFNGRL